MPAIVDVVNPLCSAPNREIRTVAAGTKIIDAIVDRNLPIIVKKGDKWILREQWSERLYEDDVIIVVHLPRGGGNSNPLRIVLLIAVAAFAPYVAGSLMGLEAGTLAHSLVVAGVTIVGTALVNALIPPPGLPGGNDSLPKASPTYSISSAGNSARIGAAIPVQYGRIGCYPDFASSPYLEYAGNQQYLYQLFCIGVGHYDIEQILIDDTPISSFEEIEYEQIEPGGKSKIYPGNVQTSPEVSNLALHKDEELGAFVAVSSSQNASSIAVDVVAPRGMYRMDEEDGSLFNVSITIEIKFYVVDEESNIETTAYFTTTETLTGATTTPVRKSFKYNVNSGRYAVSIKRTTDESEKNTVADALVWTGLRAYTDSDFTNSDVTMLAMRMRASEQLSNRSSRLIRVIATRKLPIYTYNKTTKKYSWSEPTSTRSIAWAIADIAKAKYGAKLNDKQINLKALYDLDQLWKTRSDKFDGRFDTTVTVWEALTSVSAAGRAKPYLQGGVLNIARDGPETVPVALFTPRNILKDSLKIDYIMPNNANGGIVDIEYFSDQSWKYEVVRCELSDATGDPAKLKIFGITGREQAFKEGLYRAACNRYRRQSISFSTELDGFIPSPGDLIYVAHDMPAWGQTATVLKKKNNVLFLDSELQDKPGRTHYIGIRRRDGGVDGPYVVTFSESHKDRLNIPADVSTTIHSQDDKSEEATVIVFGWADTWRIPCRILAIRPQDDLTVQIEAINEDPSVHTAEDGKTYPARVNNQLDLVYSRPEISGLIVVSKPNDPTIMLVSWRPAPGADYYIIEISEDGENWTRVLETRACAAAIYALYGNTSILRAAAVGLDIGPWVTVTYRNVSDYMWTKASNKMWTQPGNKMWKIL